MNFYRHIIVESWQMIIFSVTMVQRSSDITLWGLYDHASQDTLELESTSVHN